MLNKEGARTWKNHVITVEHFKQMRILPAIYIIRQKLKENSKKISQSFNPFEKMYGLYIFESSWSNSDVEGGIIYMIILDMLNVRSNKLNNL